MAPSQLLLLLLSPSSARQPWRSQDGGGFGERLGKELEAAIETTTRELKKDAEGGEKSISERMPKHPKMILKSKNDHYDELGNHNEAYDHEVFLGSESAHFKNMTKKESETRLGLIFDKMDIDNDTMITEDELTVWMKEISRKRVEQRTEDFWIRSNPGGKDEIAWAEFHTLQYGFLAEPQDTMAKENLVIYKQLESRDEKRWNKADRDNNLKLSKVEFLAFSHPETAKYMGDIVISEAMEDFDQDGDGLLSLPEYVTSVFGEAATAEDWSEGRAQFEKDRDMDRDGVMDKVELWEWMLPESYDEVRAEAGHLIYEADRNGDQQLSKQEVLESHHVFVSSQATAYGEALTVRDEL